MLPSIRLGVLAAVAVSFLAPLFEVQAEDATEIPTALQNYVDREEPDYQWSVTNRAKTEHGRLLQLNLTSQKWHDIVWEHAVEIFEPADLDHPKHAILFVTGGRQPPKAADDRTKQLGFGLAKASGMRVVVVHQVPNQPLFDGRVEDDLITETWLRYLKTGDETWPLLFPMVKSAVKAMDATQELSRAEFNEEISSFVITGASKRGWTSWLTPAADKRVVATAPLVIDVLNFRAQMKHQIASWGKYSDQIIDYSSKGLIVEGKESTRERQLRLMMDPYTYRRRLALPKLLVNGTNDPYWVVDAMKLYWHDLSGPTFALQIPNAGHGLGQGRELALRTVGAFARHVASKTPLPQLKWTIVRSDNEVTIQITSSVKPDSTDLWIAHSSDLDFRDEEWTSRRLEANAGRVTIPKNEHVAFFGDLRFQIQGVPYSLCTLIHRE